VLESVVNTYISFRVEYLVCAISSTFRYEPMIGSH
jgi:hypothetical protein